MAATVTTQELIEDMISAFCSPDADPRQRYVFEQSLYGLVRLAKSEQLMEIKSSVKKLTGFVTDDVTYASKVTPRD